MITEWELNKVNTFLDELKTFHGNMVENEVGSPVKVIVDWKTRKVLISGPIRAREIDINEILKAGKDKL